MYNNKSSSAIYLPVLCLKWKLVIIDDQSGDLYLFLSHAISELIMFLQLYM